MKKKQSYARNQTLELQIQQINFNEQLTLTTSNV